MYMHRSIYCQIKWPRHSKLRQLLNFASFLIQIRVRGTARHQRTMIAIWCGPLLLGVTLIYNVLNISLFPSSSIYINDLNLLVRLKNLNVYDRSNTLNSNSLVYKTGFKVCSMLLVNSHSWAQPAGNLHSNQATVKLKKDQIEDAVERFQEYWYF